MPYCWERWISITDCSASLFSLYDLIIGMFIFTLQKIWRLLVLIPQEDLQKLDKQLKLWLEVPWSFICWWSKKSKSEYSEKDLHFNRQEMSQCPVSSPFDLLNRTCHLLSCGLLSLGMNVHLQVYVYSQRVVTFSPMSGGWGQTFWLRAMMQWCRQQRWLLALSVSHNQNNIR